VPGGWWVGMLAAAVMAEYLALLQWWVLACGVAGPALFRAGQRCL
jgi:hypothetical protein